MNKTAIAGIIIAAVIVIGVISALSYVNNTGINNEEVTTTEDTGTTATEEPPIHGKNITVELSESVGITSNP